MSHGRLLALLSLAALAWAGQAALAHAQGCATCGQAGGGYCQTHHCPPWFHHCQERPPVICIKCGCPRPVCNPCALPNFGYFQTCWRPWPLPPDWSHCNVPPPAAFVHLDPHAVPGTPNLTPVAPPPTATPTSPYNAAPAITPPNGDLETLPRPLVPGPATKQGI